MHLNTSTKIYKDKLRVKTGNSGEELVCQCYPQAKRGDWYDDKKDGTIDENVYEVKSLLSEEEKFVNSIIENSNYTRRDSTVL